MTAIVVATVAVIAIIMVLATAITVHVDITMGVDKVADVAVVNAQTVHTIPFMKAVCQWTD